MNFNGNHSSQEFQNSQNCSQNQLQNSQNFQNSQKSNASSNIDDLLDLDRPISCSNSSKSFSLSSSRSTFPSNFLFNLKRNTQNNSDLDSGFDSSPNNRPKRFFWTQNRSVSNNSHFIDTKHGILSKSTASINSDLSSHNDTQIQNKNGIDLPTGFNEHNQQQLGLTYDVVTINEDGFAPQTPQNYLQSSLGTSSQPDFDQNLASSTPFSDLDDLNKSISAHDMSPNEFDDISECETIDEQAGVNEHFDDPEQTLANHSTDSIVSEMQPILHLLADIKQQYSDCAFVFALASHMCKDIYPKHSHISLKTALLLSIVSSSSQNNAKPISIMAITRDSESASTIMRHIGNYAKRFIFISDDLKFNGSRTVKTRIESNSLLLARNGVCYIGDWLGLKPASLNYLQNVIDSGRVTAETTSNIVFELKCSVWMYWTCSGKKMSQNQKDLSSISKLFGIPVVLDETPSQNVIDFLFDQACNIETESENDDPYQIDDNSFKKYLTFVSEIPTQFSSDAMDLLKYYFIVTRAIRPNILTPKSFDILQCLSECHAKLCLRYDVLRIDVIFAIELFEQFVLSVFAGQVMTKPMMNESPTTPKQVDENMRVFKQWLDKYLSDFNQNVATFFHENQ